MSKEYYIIYNGKQVGPMSIQDLLNYGLNPHSQIWCQGMPQWAEAYTVPEVMGLINASRTGFSDPEAVTPPPPPEPINVSGPQQQPLHNRQRQQTSSPYNYYSNSYGHDKSNVAFGLLAIFLGSFGVQYFYVGKATGGIICLILSLCTCGLWSIITFIQGILAICMSQQEFENKFVYSSSTFPIL